VRSSRDAGSKNGRGRSCRGRARVSLPAQIGPGCEARRASRRLLHRGASAERGGSAPRMTTRRLDDAEVRALAHSRRHFSCRWPRRLLIKADASRNTRGSGGLSSERLGARRGGRKAGLGPPANGQTSVRSRLLGLASLGRLPSSTCSSAPAW
jgi:hypothetical protein